MCSDFWERNGVRQFEEAIIPNHFDDRLWLKHFGMTKTAFDVVCNEIGSLQTFY